MNKKHIKESLRKYLNTKILLESWFHGTYDSREIEKEGGFTNKTIKVEYVNNPKALDKLQEKMNKAKISGDEELYFSLLNKVSNFKDYYSYNKPLFITDKYSVAKTYADGKRAFDYQNAIEKVYEVDVNCDKIVKIIAIGDRFRYISLDKVKNGFINAGISEERIDELISMFNYYYNDKGIKTDVIGAIGNILNFDCIDVIGVLDSYHGGTIKSTVRMVLDPSKVKIKTKQNLNENIILTEELKTLYHGNKSGYKLDNISFDNNNYLYLTSIFRYALMYAKGNEDGVTGLKIDSSKLLDLRSLGTNKIDSKTFYKETKQYFPSKLLTKNQNNSLWELIRLDFDGDIKKTFQSRGYDGLIIIEQKDGEKFESYVLFNNNPIIDILNTNIKESLRKYLVENKVEKVRKIGLSFNDKIEGGFLTKKQSGDLQKEIEANYDDKVSTTTKSGFIKWGQDSNDIRTFIYNYDNPLIEKDLNGVNLRVASGLTEGKPYSGNRRKTYLLYADGNIIGKFYNIEDLKKVVKYVYNELNKPNITEYLNEQQDNDKQLYLTAYYNRINKEYDNLFEKVKNNPNFVFILGIDMIFEKCGNQNRCETNTYDYIKTKLENGESDYYPVGGFLFNAKSLTPIEHWWVFDKKNNKHIEVTPFIDENPWCYAGIINYDINEEILNSKNIWNVDFFSGGNVYSWYFKVK